MRCYFPRRGTVIIAACFAIYIVTACGSQTTEVKEAGATPDSAVGKDSIVKPKDTLTNKQLVKIDSSLKQPVDSSFKVYLSFDDGPEAGSEEVNRIIAKDSAIVNVFLIGRNVTRKDSMKQIFKRYKENPFIEVGNHSYTHADKQYHLYYKDAGHVVRDFERNADILQLTNKIARLPGRNTWRLDGRQRSDLSDDKSAADSLVARGFSIFGWDIEWKYLPGQGHTLFNADKMMRIVHFMMVDKRSFTPGHIVILCHDGMFVNPYNQLQLELFIKKLEQTRGYRFEQLGNYPGCFDRLRKEQQ